MKVLGIGEVVLDKVHLLQNYPIEGSKIKPLKVKSSIGGPVPSALVLLSRLGAKCSFIGSVGLDRNGQKVKDRFKKEKIIVMPIRGKETKVNTVLVNRRNGSRTIIKGNRKSQLISNISKRVIQNADLILLDRHEPKAFDEILKKKDSKTRVIIDPSTEVSQRTLNMLKFVDYPILPIESLKKIRRFENCQKNLEHLYKIVNKTIIITAGEKGSIIFNGKNLELIPAYKVKVVDTLGAGDVFRGAFGYGIMHKWGVKRSTKFANAVSALQCTKFGNVSAIPYKDDIEKFRRCARCRKVELNDFNLSDYAS